MSPGKQPEDARRDLVTDDSYDLVIDGGKSSEEESRSAADLRRDAYPGAPRWISSVNRQRRFTHRLYPRSLVVQLRYLRAG